MRTSCSTVGICSAFVVIAFFGAVGSAVAVEEGEAAAAKDAEGKVLPLFSVVKFPNAVCQGSSRNGTCYTSEECANKGGTSSDSCAEGFGVCCIFELSCGEGSNQNCTYLVQSSTPAGSPCNYQICKCSPNVCRIRYDFTTMVISGPETDTTQATGALATFEQTGDCNIDTLTFTGVDMGAPIICGTNTGQHLYVDAGESCHTANINLDLSSSTTSRSWDIKVTQYECGSENGGPPGCLQYFTSTTGSVASFNFPTGTTVGATATHLSNQDYNMCFRRASGYCYICFIPTISTSTTTTAQNTFGLSISPTAIIAQSATDTSCTSDYLEIIHADTMANAATITNDGVKRICGRIFSTTAISAISISVCTRQIPFNLRFHTDADEAGLNTGTPTAANTETGLAPGGIVGFKLSFVQTAC